MTHDEVIRRIVAYTQHHDDCALNRCAYCGKPRADRAHGDHDYCEPRLFGGRCSCGLDDVLILLRGSGVSSMRNDDQGASLLPADQPASPASREALPNKPPTGAVEIAVQMSTYSPCQSKRGAVVFAWQGGAVHILGRGYNHKTKFECDSSDACKATCRKDAIHAEQMALINAAKTGFIVGMEALHAKTVNGALVASGGPSCVECSKLLRTIGVVAMWLYHDDGWRRYDIDEFHALSLIGGATQPLSEASHVEGSEIEPACAACEVLAASGSTHGRKHTCVEPPPHSQGEGDGDWGIPGLRESYTPDWRVILDLLHDIRIPIAASAQASHLMDGFKIVDGEPRSNRRETDDDRLLQRVDAVINLLDNKVGRASAVEGGSQ